jgi:enoyl-CoA hydratase
MIQREAIEDVVVLRLDRGKGNALTAGFLAAIREAFEQLRAEPPRGVVLGSTGPIFCAGLDLLELEAAGEAELATLLDELHAALREIFTFPRPVVAAINGHAVAGGALLTLACDQRVMAMGEGKWGLTEAQLGLVVPASMIEMCRYALPRRVLERLLYAGQAYPGFKAREMGALDDLVDEADLLDRSLELVRAWTPVPEAFADIKSRLRGPTLEAMEAARPLDRQFVDGWLDPDVRQRLAAAVERLRSRG